MTYFSDFRLLSTLQASLAEQGLKATTEIQSRVLPVLLAGTSVVGVSETGSGKTLAYILPVLHQLKTLENDGDKITKDSRPRAVVIVPTRELGEQVARNFKPFTHSTRIRVRSLLGGSTLEVAKKNIQGPFEVLVATPGRLIKLLDRGLLSLGDVRVLVFDEADQMLDQGFLPDAKKIAAACPSGKQLVMFSATVSAEVQTLMKTLFTDATVIRTSGSNQVVATLTTCNKLVSDSDRFSLLESVLRENVSGGTMIFTNTRKQCDLLAAELAKVQRNCVVYRGSMDKVERRANLKAFRTGQIGLLISTDLASRGLDVEHVGRVINYHMPYQMDNYLHRAGRTARAGRRGLVINFVGERDKVLIEQLKTTKNHQ
ncbi:MAG: DEAD/DEAH box helicase [Deltaproteobacteria bacterium]|nr:DEAD/DEAH box helicase [Deltaproteobacteria bacterium]